MQYFNEPILTAVANAGTVTSAAIDSRFRCGATVQAKFTDGSAAGTLKIQGSNDPNAPTNWNDIPNMTATVASGATTCTPNTDVLLCYQWVRVVFVSSGGAGTISANLHMIG